MKMIQRRMAFILILSILISVCPTHAASKVLSLNQAIALGIDNSVAILKADKAIYEKGIALKQAKKAVNYGYKKLRRLFEKAPTFDKALGLATKIEKAQKDYVVAKSARVDAEKKAKYAVITQYLKTYSMQEQEKAAEITLNQETSKLNIGKVKLSQGLITEDSYQAQSDLVKEKEAALEKAKADFISAKAQMKDLLGVDVSNRSFSYTYLKGALPQSKVINVIREMYKDSHALYALDETIKLNTHIVNANNKLYKGKFGSSRMSGMNSLINKGIGNITDKELMVGYDNLVDALISKWGDDWKSYYEIDLVLISFKIPKLFRFGEFDGVRYLEDSRYSLSIAISQAQQSIMEERTTRKTLTEIVIALFGTVNSKTLEYESLKKAFDALARTYELNQNKYKMGLVEADVLIDQKNELDSMELQMAELIYEINVKIVELDAMTNGAYSRLLKVEKAKNPNLKASPFLRPSAEDLMAEAESLDASTEIKGAWTLTPVAEGMTETLTIVPSGARASTVAYYQLFNTDGVVLSEKIAIAEGFTHLTLTFSEKSDLVIYLIDANDAVLYKAGFDGYGQAGALLFQ